MIKEFVELWEENKAELEEYFKTTVQNEYNTYSELVELVVSRIINKREDCYTANKYDVEKMTVIDNGEYSGTQIFIIPEDTYEPSIDEYIYTSVNYGSCSGCDTLEGITWNDDETPNKEELGDYMTLCLHLIQRFKKMGD